MELEHTVCCIYSLFLFLVSNVKSTSLLPIPVYSLAFSSVGLVIQQVPSLDLSLFLVFALGTFSLFLKIIYRYGLPPLLG